MPMLSIDRHLPRGAEWDLVGRHVILDIDYGQRPAARGSLAEIDKRAAGLYLPDGDGVDHKTNLTLEHAPGHRIESDLRLVAGFHPLQGVLLECRAKLPVPRVRVDEHHGGPHLQ